MLDLVLSILVLAAIALLGGAVFLWRRGGHARQAWLMVLLSVVAIANLAIWLVPGQGGEAPVTQAQALGQ